MGHLHSLNNVVGDLYFFNPLHLNGDLSQNLYGLNFCLIDYFFHNFLHDFLNFHDPLNNSRNWDNFFNDSFYFDDPWNFNQLLYYFLNDAGSWNELLPYSFDGNDLLFDDISGVLLFYHVHLWLYDLNNSLLEQNNRDFNMHWLSHDLSFLLDDWLFSIFCFNSHFLVNNRHFDNSIHWLCNLNCWGFDRNFLYSLHYFYLGLENRYLLNYFHRLNDFLSLNNCHNFFHNLRIGHDPLHYPVHRHNLLNITHNFNRFFHNVILHPLVLHILRDRDYFFYYLLHLNNFRHFLNYCHYFLHYFLNLHDLLHYLFNWHNLLLD